MNVSDTERASGRLSANDFLIVEKEEEADVILLNTCSIREKAENKVFTRIGEIRGNSAGKKQFIGVMGCVAQLEGAAIFSKASDVAVVTGTGALDRLPALLTETINTGERQLDLGERVVDDWEAEFSMRRSRHSAFIPIIEGCNKFCTYCIVPYSRGRERSRGAVSIVEEVLKLKAEGVKEVCLIGQNVNSYRPVSDAGLKGFKGATPFSRLLRAVAATGICRIKFTTSFPRDFHVDIVSAIEEHSNLCEWVHLPVQSGSDNVLKLMRRGYTSAFYLNLVDRMRKSSRDISLTTDIIVGFPGESDNDFKETLDLIEKSEFEGAYIFKYSERKGTPAQMIDDTIPESLKTERFLAADMAQKRIQRKRYERFIGGILDVLVEKSVSKHEGQLSGHSTCQKVVNFKGANGLIGEVVKVYITEAKENCLMGELLS